MVLYVNACVRDESRTERLAKAVLDKIGEEYEEVRLEDLGLLPLTKESLGYRAGKVAAGDYSDPMFKYAKQFAEAEIIVVSAPYWDLSFPALLKTYLEHVFVVGIVNHYGDNGRPVGQCKGQKLYYVTTAGGPLNPKYGYEYVSDLATKAWGVKETALISAQMLDIVGNDVEAIMQKAIDEIAL